MRRILLWGLALFLAGSLALADEDLRRGRQLWTDPDGSPDQTPFSEITVSSGTLVDDGDGTATLTNGGGGITIGTTTITGGTDTRVLFNDGGVVGEDAGLTYVKGTDALTIVGPLSAGASTLGDTTATSLTVDTLTTGVTLDTDGDGALSLQSASSGFAEEIRVNLDDTSNTAVWSSSTGVTSWVFTGMNLDVSGAIPRYIWTDSDAGDDDFEAVVEDSTFRIANTTDGVTGFIQDANNDVGLGEVGKEISSLSVRTTIAGDSGVRLPVNAIGVQELDAIDEPADGEAYSYDSATGRGEWAAAAGSGDITSVGDVASGAAFDGTQGTTLTFNNAGGDATIDYDGSQFNLSQTLFVSGSITTSQNVPTVVLRDASGGHDDFEWWADADIMGMANTTSGAQIWRTTTSDEFQTLTKFIAGGGADLRGIVTAMGATVFSHPIQVSKTVVDPDTAQTNSDAYPLFDVDSAIFPFGIRISSITIGTNASTSIAYALEEWTSPTSGVASTICGLNLVSASERTFTGGLIADPTVAAGSWVFLNLDTTALTWFTITVRFHALTA